MSKYMIHEVEGESAVDSCQLAAHDAEIRADERERAALRVLHVPVFDDGDPDLPVLIRRDDAIAAARGGEQK